MKINSVLLVDDDEITNFLNKTIIDRLGFVKNINVAMNGKEAIDLLEKNKQLPEMIFLDINMPLMNGFEFLKEFNNMEFKEGSRPLVVVVSSSSDPNDQKQSRELGIKYYLNKPLSEESLLNLINEEYSFL